MKVRKVRATSQRRRVVFLSPLKMPAIVASDWEPTGDAREIFGGVMAFWLDRAHGRVQWWDVGTGQSYVSMSNANLYEKVIEGNVKQ